MELFSQAFHPLDSDVPNLDDGDILPKYKTLVRTYNGLWKKAQELDSENARLKSRLQIYESPDNSAESSSSQSVTHATLTIPDEGTTITREDNDTVAPLDFASNSLGDSSQDSTDLPVFALPRRQSGRRPVSASTAKLAKQSGRSSDSKRRASSNGTDEDNIDQISYGQSAQKKIRRSPGSVIASIEQSSIPKGPKRRLPSYDSDGVLRQTPIGAPKRKRSSARVSFIDPDSKHDSNTTQAGKTRVQDSTPRRVVDRQSTTSIDMAPHPPKRRKIEQTDSLLPATQTTLAEHEYIPSSPPTVLSQHKSKATPEVQISFKVDTACLQIQRYGSEHRAELAGIHDSFAKAAEERRQKDPKFGPWEVMATETQGCVFRYIKKIAASYTIDNERRDAVTCKGCFNAQVPCVRYNEDYGYHIVPLPEEAREGVSKSDIAYFVYPEANEQRKLEKQHRKIWHVR